VYSTKRPRNSLLHPLVLGLVLSFHSPVSAQTLHLTEDFTSWQYRDPVTTTAVWDTVQGQISLGTFPELIGTVDKPGSARQVVCDGVPLFVANETSFRVLELGDPVAPVALGAVTMLGPVHNLATAGEYIYVADQGVFE